MITLTAAIIFVNLIPFVITYGRRVELKVLQLCSQASFIIQTISMDMEFEKVKLHLSMENVNTNVTN